MTNEASETAVTVTTALPAASLALPIERPTNPCASPETIVTVATYAIAGGTGVTDVEILTVATLPAMLTCGVDVTASLTMNETDTTLPLVALVVFKALFDVM